MVPADYSFARAGRDLTDWLLDAVSTDRATRKAAGKMLLAMRYAVPTLDTDTDDIDGEIMSESHAAAFQAAVESCVLASNFPGREFIEQLAEGIIVSQIEWVRLCNIREEQTNRVMDRIEAKRRADRSERDAERWNRRMRKALCGDTKFEDAKLNALNDATHFLIMFNTLGKSIERGPNAIRRLLTDSHHRHSAVEALEKASPEFAALMLVDVLNAPPGDGVAVSASGVIARAIPADTRRFTEACDELESLLSRPLDLSSDDDSEAFHKSFYSLEAGWHIAGIFTRLGSAACTQYPDSHRVIPLLLRMLDDDHLGRRAAGATALGECSEGADSDLLNLVVDRLLLLSYDHPWVSGRAIDALGRLAVNADKVVPRLVDLFDSFEEFDPDEGYGGSHSRVCRALKGFGEKAASAIPKMSRVLQDVVAGELDDDCSDILQLAAHLGPAVSALTPELERYAAKMNVHMEELLRLEK